MVYRSRSAPPGYTAYAAYAGSVPFQDDIRQVSCRLTARPASAHGVRRFRSSALTAHIGSSSGRSYTDTPDDEAILKLVDDAIHSTPRHLSRSPSAGRRRSRDNRTLVPAASGHNCSSTRQAMLTERPSTPHHDGSHSRPLTGGIMTAGKRPSTPSEYMCQYGMKTGPLSNGFGSPMSGAASRELRRHLKADPACESLRPALEHIRRKAPQRFQHVREALRICGNGHDMHVSRDEVRNFFRQFGASMEGADELYQVLAKGSGVASYRRFVRHVGPYLELPGVETAVSTAGGRVDICQPYYNEQWYMKQGEPSPHEVQQCRENLALLGLRRKVERPASRGSRCSSPFTSPAIPRPPLTPRHASGSRRPASRPTSQMHSPQMHVAESPLRPVVEPSAMRAVMEQSRFREPAAAVISKAEMQCQSIPGACAAPASPMPPSNSFGGNQARSSSSGGPHPPPLPSPGRNGSCSSPARNFALNAGGRPIARPLAARNERGVAPHRARDTARRPQQQ